MFLVKAMLEILNKQMQKEIKLQENINQRYCLKFKNINLSRNIDTILNKLNSLVIPSLEETTKPIDNIISINNSIDNDFSDNFNEINEDSWDVISNNINNSIQENLDYKSNNEISSQEKLLQKNIEDFSDNFDEIAQTEIIENISIDSEKDSIISDSFGQELSVQDNLNKEVITEDLSNIDLPIENSSIERGEQLSDFIEYKSFIHDTSKYEDTPYVHKYEYDNTQSENDKYIENHYAFISDFYPVNNIDVLNLLKIVRESLKNKIHTSAIDIYRYWLRYLKNYNQDYHLYDYRNFNDQGEFLGRIDQQLNDNILDDYINQDISVITYDEAKAKQEQKEKDKTDALNILKSGTYVSEIDPKLGSMFVK